MLASLHGGLTWCIVQRGLALLDRVLLLRKIHLEFFFLLPFLQEEHSSNAGPTRADQMFGWLALLGHVLLLRRIHLEF